MPTTQAQLKKLKNISLGSKDFQKIIQTALDGICIYQDRKVIFVSDRLTEISGYTKEEILGRHLFEFFPLTELPKIAAIVARRETGEDVRGTNESVLIAKDGVHKDVQLSSAILMIDGKVSVISFINDISQRKANEAEIKRRLEFQEKVSMLSTQFMNYSSEEIDLGIQKSLKDLGEYAKVPRCFVILFNNNQQYVDSIYEWHFKDGSFQHSPDKLISLAEYRWAMNKITTDGIVYIADAKEMKILNPYIHTQLGKREIRSIVMVPLTFQKKLIGIGGFCDSEINTVWSEDSTALLKVAGEMFANAIVRKQTELEIKELYKSQSILYSQVAHSLRTTFAIVLGNLEMLNKQPKPAVRSELISTIRGSVSDANLQLKELFEIARLNTMPKHSGNEIVAVSNIFQDLEKQSRFLFKSYFPEQDYRKHICFQIDGDAMLIADQREILNGLLMVIDNALIHSPYPGEMPSVKVMGEVASNIAIIAVEDQGKGIPEDELGRVFEIFYRADKYTPGQGIGLAHAKKIIESHNGEISIESKPNQGTRCVIKLPISPDQAMSVV